MDHSSETVTLPALDYDADDVLVVREPEQLRALGDDLRTAIVVRLRESACSTSELAAELGIPKGTVGHHLKVLERAGLIRVVRTRKVRALTEKYYGRVARLFILKSEEGSPSEPFHARLNAEDARKLRRRLDRLAADFKNSDTPGGAPHELVVGVYPTEAPRG
ncbi:MAG: winged helix-turn-helix transcriptional regulator [Actinobacteria bacterium]|nr:MAG: winged helix-turn-helix transcriptional regulator [Actinomycetota bacterium]